MSTRRDFLRMAGAGALAQDLAGQHPEEVDRLKALWQAWAGRAQVLLRPGRRTGA